MIWLPVPSSPLIWLLVLIPRFVIVLTWPKRRRQGQDKAEDEIDKGDVKE